MKEQTKDPRSRRLVSFGQKHGLALRGIALVVVLTVPIALYDAARMGNDPLIWGLVALMAAAMALAVWAG